jgi:hypothetical protein
MFNIINYEYNFNHMYMARLCVIFFKKINNFLMSKGPTVLPFHNSILHFS